MPTAEQLVKTPAAVRLIALVGNPNSGKTSVFNQLTGLHHKVGNYPGVTVERREGRLIGETSARLLDLPGCYSLTPRSLDERIARDALLGWAKGVERPDAVIVVVDSANLERNLFLATQVLELNLPTVIACNMQDVVRKRGDRIDLKRLSERLGAPVVGTSALTGEGLVELRTLAASLTDQPRRQREFRTSDRTASALDEVRSLLRPGRVVDVEAEELVAALLLTPSVSDSSSSAYAKLPEAAAGRLAALHARIASDGGESPAGELVSARYHMIGEMLDGVVRRSESTTVSVSDRIDRIVTHKVFGLFSFAFLMALMFLAIFSWAEPLMGGIEWVMGALGDAGVSLLGPGMLTDLLVDGVIAGVGNVVIFFPQICILFLFITVLEDSGYMARVAFVMDRLMRGAGLHGKSFIPLLSSFACAVPGIMATRTIENRRDRLTTLLVAPLMSCSARLPIYIILISALFGSSIWLKTGIMFGMYALGTVTALLMAMLFKKTILRGPTPTFIMELPPYRRPQVLTALRHTWDRGRLFLTEAGTIILACSVVLWALAYFPRLPESATADSGAQLRQSWMGRIGQTMEPVIEPLGFDWRIGVGLAGSFAAREVFISTMGIVYGLEEEADEESVPLREKMTAATWPDGRKVYTPLVGISLMVFYVLACQCMSTLAVVRRETGGWRWPIFMFTYMTALAYLASLLVYQGGRAIGWS